VAPRSIALEATRSWKTSTGLRACRKVDEIDRTTSAPRSPTYKGWLNPDPKPALTAQVSVIGCDSELGNFIARWCLSTGFRSSDLVVRFDSVIVKPIEPN